MAESVPTSSKSQRAGIAFQVVLALVFIGLCLLIRNIDSPWQGRFGRLLRQHKDLKFDDLIYVQLWWAAYIDRIIVGLLLLLSPLWLRWSQRVASTGRLVVGPKRWIWLFSVLALAIGLRAARMDRGLERDEQDTVRRDILGFYITMEDGREDYRLPPWSETMWEDAQANNPFLFSITARGALTVWQKLSGNEPAQVNRIVLRLPALIPGVLSLVALWWWFRMMGLMRAADIALLLGALHPMHVDYSTQARGYAYVMLFTALGLCFAWLALTEGRWRHWAGLAGCYLGSLFGNPGSIYFCGMLSIMIAAWFLIRIVRDRDANARAGLVRFTVCCTVSGALYVPLVLPALPQAAGYLKTFLGALDGPWPLEALSKYFTGVMMPTLGPNTIPEVEAKLTTWDFFMRDYVHSERLLLVLVFAAVPALLVMGYRRIAALGPEARLLVMAGIAAPLVAYLYHRPKETQFLYYWYLIYALPVVIALVAAGLDRLGERLGTRVSSKFAPWLPTMGFLLIQGIANASGPGRLNWFPGTQIRDEVYDRGKFLWITGKDGRTKRVPKSGS